MTFSLDLNQFLGVSPRPGLRPGLLQSERAGEFQLALGATIDSKRSISTLPVFLPSAGAAEPWQNVNPAGTIKGTTRLSRIMNIAYACDYHVLLEPK